MHLNNTEKAAGAAVPSATAISYVRVSVSHMYELVSHAYIIKKIPRQSFCKNVM